MNLPVSTPKLGKWRLLQHIAAGSTANVYLGFNPETKQETAVKIYDYCAEVTADLISQEKEIIESLRHPNVISMNEFLEDIDFEDARGCTFKVSALVMENAPHGSILELIDSLGSLPEVLSRTYFCQLIEAIEYLHEKNIAHRDIKPENLLLSRSFCLKLADFGHSLDLKKSSCSSRVGTSQYFPPEMHVSRSFEAKEADLFAAAILLFCMISGSMPFIKATESDKLYSNFFNESTKNFWSFHETVSSGDSSKQLFNYDLKDILEKMFSPDPKKRLSLSEIKKHPWYEKEKLDEEEIERMIRELRK